MYVSTRLAHAVWGNILNYCLYTKLQLASVYIWTAFVKLNNIAAHCDKANNIRMHGSLYNRLSRQPNNNTEIRWICT